ncbi:Dehydrogenase E1 component [Colletotrichum higginsianum IMI 349063]|uniref:2-oxoisovalerate dehydrogenase subunit alpha n=2 Tax=Colletotrichum higginsianum TaxID=80884 RepID=A0A1B7YBB5_COLHI|nr:Dehydrogenase E1 component [Colletotrichum higginsianum IMI 349063]OBR09307.1 Dehydrogenase E1 component [Colletotrichum higginsianum IMI 349063]TIC95316.1 2-oxoisovalerate dehydrogenase subunit alpha, mitochondrial [Colletotrichum higginsianum]
MRSSRIIRRAPRCGAVPRAGGTATAAFISPPTTTTASRSQSRRAASSLSQRPNANHVSFPGAVKSAFTSTLKFETPGDYPAVPTYRVVDQDGAIVDDAFVPDLGEEGIVKLYKDMVFISVMDLIMFDAQRQGRLSFYMVSAGEEALSVGSASVLTPEDVIFCQYREQGVFKQRGFTSGDFMNQLFANSKDPGKGRNMPVHYGSKELNIHTISSPLATQLPQASGAAYALKMQRMQDPSIPPRVVAAYFGEGAASEGDFHAALNIAATRSCPVIFICRNNGYAISTPTLEQYRGDGIASRGLGYGIDTIRVDGNDIWAVREATKRARGMALENGGRPILIEAMTYRVSHHSTSDDSFAYRARVEVEDWKRRDNPITRLRKYMEARGMWDEGKEKECRESTRREVLKAFKEAEMEKKPPIRGMFEDVYEELTPDLKQQMAQLREHLDKYPEEYEVSEFEGGKDSLKS